MINQLITRVIIIMSSTMIITMMMIIRTVVIIMLTMSIMVTTLAIIMIKIMTSKTNKYTNIFMLTHGSQCGYEHEFRHSAGTRALSPYGSKS